MTEYIREIQRQLVTVYGCPERPDMPGVPMSAPDGEYLMTIEGKVDRIRIVGGRIDCTNVDD